MKCKKACAFLKCLSLKICITFNIKYAITFHFSVQIQFPTDENDFLRALILHPILLFSKTTLMWILMVCSVLLVNGVRYEIKFWQTIFLKWKKTFKYFIKVWNPKSSLPYTTPVFNQTKWFYFPYATYPPKPRKRKH